MKPIQIGDHLALDFLNSTAAPCGVTVDWIADGPGFVDWLTDVDAIDADDRRRIAASLSTEALDRAAHDARDFREWLRGVVLHAKRGGPEAVSPDDLARLNAALGHGVVRRKLDPESRRVMIERPWREPEELLARVAEAAADLLAAGDFAQIRKCECPECPLWFYDRTKSHRRRWCSPAACGNRAKVAAHRERKRRACQVAVTTP